MSYRDINDFTVLGIGGKGAFYIAKYLHLLGKKVKGYDLKQSERTKELEKLGIDIVYSNPDTGKQFDTQGYIYSNDLPQSLQREIKETNSGLISFEVGELYHQIVDDFEQGILSSDEKKMFKESGIAPLYNLSDSSMKYIGVTGTDGKTTTCTMIYHILKELGFKPAMVTTVSAKIGDMDIDTGFHTTTPSSQELYELILRAQKENCTHLILETTSHGLAQGRLMGIRFDAIAYTNITEEHLDYHKTWESLAYAKSLLIRRHSKQDCIVVLNRDDDRSYEYLSKLSEHFTYSINDKADIYATDIQERGSSLRFMVNGINIHINILGRYNVSNFLAACALVVKLEERSIEEIADAISSFSTIKGRMEVLQENPYMVIVDYAHTPNALLNALASAKRLTSGRVIHVFGCAGHRDFFKRSLMGKISNENADITILTAEDPRLESLREINDEIVRGYEQGSNKDSELYRFDDDKSDVKVREDAIKKALKLAEDGDLVIITGKAHEMSLCFGQTEYPWNDIEETRKLLSML